MSSSIVGPLLMLPVNLLIIYVMVKDIIDFKKRDNELDEEVEGE